MFKYVNIFIDNGWIIISVNKNVIVQKTIKDFEKEYDLTIPYEKVDFNTNTMMCEINGEAKRDMNDAFCNELLKLLNINNVSYDYMQEFTETTRDLTLEEIKVNKISELKNYRDTEEQSPITYNGYRWDFDDKAIQRINGAIIALSNGGEIVWTSADDEEIRGVTADDLRGVISASAVRSNALHVKYRELRERVEQAKTKEQVEAIKW